MQKRRNVKVRAMLDLPLWWNGFLPEKEKDRVAFSVMHDGVQRKVQVGIVDRRTNISNPGVLPRRLKNHCFPGNSLTCWFALPLPMKDLQALRLSGSTQDLELFRTRIKEIVNIVYGRLIDIIRNRFGQYWLSPTLVVENCAWTSSEWLDTDGKWKAVFSPQIFLKSRIRLATGLSRTDWRHMEQLLASNCRTNIVEVLIANAKAHMEAGDSRSALVEVVAALEAAIKRLIPGLLHDVALPRIPKNKIESAVEKLGLRLSAEILLKYQRPDLSLNPGTCDSVVRAVEARNALLHGGRKTIKKGDAENMLHAVCKVIYAIHKHRQNGA